MYNTSSLKEQCIVLSSAEETDTQVRIKDETGKTYSFFKNKKTGGPTVAYNDFKSFRIGEQVNVVFDEKPGTQGGTFRNVARIKATGSSPAPRLTPSGNVNPYARPANTPPSGMVSGSALARPPMDKGREIAGMAFAKSLLESGQSTIADITNPAWWASAVWPAVDAMNAGNSIDSEDLKVEGIPF